MDILIIGGGIFVGRAMVSAARSGGHRVTVFNRGRASPAPDGVAAIIGDRDGDLAGLRGRSWDAVIDTCGYFPRQVRSLLAAIQASASHYTFISSVSAYQNLGEPGITEDAALSALDDPAAAEVTPKTYGPLKAACEQAAAGFSPSLIIRPGIIIGHDDSTGRFTYWAKRAARGGEMLVPGTPDTPLQLIDVDDLAAWTIKMADERAAGVFNAVGDATLTWGEMIQACAEAAGIPCHPTWVDDAFLLAHQAQDWAKLPLSIPASQRSHSGMYRISGAAAAQRGLIRRPLKETVAALLAWADRPEAANAKQPGLTPAQEAELLAAWHAGRST